LTYTVMHGSTKLKKKMELKILYAINDIIETKYFLM
jgi:hypothetical protein